MAAAIVGLVVLGAGISTGVAFLLAVRREATETRNWRRNHCLEASSEFMGLVNTIVTAAGECYYAECGTEKHLKNCEIVFDRFPELSRASFRLLLLAPPMLADPLNALVSYLDKEIGWKFTRCPKEVSKLEREQINKKFAELSTQFMLIARRDLGIDPYSRV
jgi:hypothetical protein